MAEPSALEQHLLTFEPIEYRSIDGSGNNLSDPGLNATGDNMSRVGPAHFADGISIPLETVNPRLISNVVVGQGDPDLPNSLQKSGFMYAWGQFLDHDIDLVGTDGVHHIDVAVPNGDPVLPDGSVIPITRSVIDPATGAGTNTPATAVNTITGWIDASMVYGSDQATMNALRLADGHMATSEGNYLPIVNGMYLAGDVRASENPSLTALQTLFVREHNHQVDALHAAHPDWDGEHLYQQARAIVTGEIQNITYSEFLPHLLGKNVISDYHGYNPSVDPHIAEEFAGAAYRFGHSIVSGGTEKIDNNGNLLEEKDLKDAFFESPAAFAANSGADGILRHLADDTHPEMDVRITGDLRNFLSDPPAAIDLAAINIQRGHDLGLGTLNETRVALGLQPYTSFTEITNDKATVDALQTAFGTVDKIDLWTGGLSEEHVNGGELGQTFARIVGDQFTALRDGDRLWFENQLDKQTVDEIKKTTLADVILRNTDTTHLQEDVFISADANGAEPPKEPHVTGHFNQHVHDMFQGMGAAHHHFDVFT